MAINFDTLPQENPNGLVKPGLYLAEIMEADMKQGQDLTKPKYLNLKYSITNHDGVNCGQLFDIIAESDSPAIMYKLSRFVQACGIPLQGSMELSDLAKLVKGKKIAVDVEHSRPKKGEEEGFKPRAQVSLFGGGEVYYKANEYEEVWARMNPEAAAAQPDFEPTGDTTPFNATDGAPVEY